MLRGHRSGALTLSEDAMATLFVFDGFTVDMTNFGDSSIFSGEQRFRFDLIEFVVSDFFFTDAFGVYYYDVFENLIDGTVTEVHEYFDGFRGYQINGLSMEVFTALGYVDDFDPSGLMAYAFRGTDDIRGNAGDDALSGFAGNDLVAGYGGDDLVIGGLGVDKLYGGLDFDVFYLVGKPKPGNVDQIKDYNDFFDEIWLDFFSYNLPLGRLASRAFFVGEHVHDANDRIIYDKADGQLLFDRNGTGPGGETLIATIAKNIGGLNAGDFFVV